MTLVVLAWNGLTDRPIPYETAVRYSGRFSDYNGSAQLYRNKLTVSLSSSWKEITTDIQIGMIQHLLVRLLKIQKNTTEMDLYHSFLKNVHKAVAKTQNDPVLESSFTRINDRFFGGALEQPNLTWGSGTRRLGAYHYGSDTVMISTVLAEDFDLLDYVMYHELLHKYHKFSTKNGRSTYHSRQFREDEKKYPGAEILEKRLSNLARSLGFGGLG